MSFRRDNIYYREGNGNPLQYSSLENPMDRGAWHTRVHGFHRSWTQCSDKTITILIYLESENEKLGDWC